MVDFRVSVVLPAGGCGSRMGMEIPKQYCRILGRPLISYTIEAFESISWVENIAIATPAEENYQKLLENIVLEFGHKKVVTTTGGSTRHRSIYNGVECLNTSERKPDVVVIHDAVRPFIQEAFLKDIALAAHKHGACGAVRPLISTVLAREQDGFIDHSLDRSKYIASEMPQAFQFDVILNAYQKCTEDDFDYGTECLHLALKYSNTRALLIDGPDYLWKVTHRKDLFAAEGIIKGRYRKYALFTGDCSELGRATENEFKTKGIQILQNDEIKSLKINIVISFTLLSREILDTSFDRIRNELTKHLEHIERNGTLVIVCRGCESDLEKLKVITRDVARKGKEYGLICCSVWCHNIVKSFLEQEEVNKVRDIAQLIVSVALDTTPSFSGQVFTVLDTT